MGEKIIALQGKVFTVELVSSVGSTNYGWCISKLPSGIWVMGSENIPVRIGKTIQEFYFGAENPPKDGSTCTIEFSLVCLSDFNKAVKQRTVEVTVIPSNSDDFVKYSENATSTIPPYGYVSSVMTDYGYPCGMQDAMVKYGYPCGVQDAAVKYGYPSGVQEPAVKYGYPCGVQDATVKYGYPGGVQEQEPIVAYGYPGGVQEPIVEYGYPSGVQEQEPIVEYGYPSTTESSSN